MASTQLAQNVLQSGYTRVFMIEGVGSCSPSFTFLDCARFGAIDQTEGDPTRIECPDPENPDQFYVDSLVRGERGLGTSEIVAGFTARTKSLLAQKWRDGCPFGLQLRIGQCSPINDPTNYIKSINLTGVFPTGYSTDQLGALEQADRARVNETLSISFIDFYEIMAQLDYAAAPLTIPAPMVGVSVCDKKACATDNCKGSTACGKLYGVDQACNIHTSLDGGGNWTSQPILDGCCTALPVGCPICICGKMLIVEADGTIAYIERNDLDNQNTDAWQHALTGINDTPTTVAVYKNIAFVGTQSGQIHAITCDCGVKSTLVYNGISHGSTAINAMTVSANGKLVAVGDNGVSISSKDFARFIVSPAKPTSSNLTAVVAKTDNTWLVGDDKGVIYCTDSSGCAWVTTAFPCGVIGAGPVTSLVMSDEQNIWAAVNGIVYRTVDSGVNWVREPNDMDDPACRLALSSLGTITKLAACGDERDFILASGVNANNNGIIVTGN